MSKSYKASQHQDAMQKSGQHASMLDFAIAAAKQLPQRKLSRQEQKQAAGLMHLNRIISKAGLGLSLGRQEDAARQERMAAYGKKVQRRRTA